MLDSEECGTDADHAVAIVGYGKDKEDTGLDYWLVRDSRGDDWCHNGYIKIARTSGDGICAINTRPLYPIVAN